MHREDSNFASFLRKIGSVRTSGASLRSAIADRSAYGTRYETKPMHSPLGKNVCPSIDGQAALFEPQKHDAHFMGMRFYRNAKHFYRCD